MADEINFEGKLIKKRWKVLKKIGSGSTSNIYMSIDNIKQQVVAIKITESGNSQILQHEAGVINILCPENQKILGFPQLYWIGQDSVYNKYHFIAMEMLGPSLQDLFIACNKKFSLKTVLLIANGCLNQIERLHKQNYVHCDVKPQNFLMGLNDCSHIIYLIDFGISQLYKDFNTDTLIQYKIEDTYKGSLCFMSLNNHYKICHGRRDDLESLGYMLIYFLKGRLPWEKYINNNNKNKYDIIQKKKLDVIFEEFCQDLPHEFVVYLNYCKNLMYYEEPDYNFLKSLFIDLMHKNNYQLDFEYDWINKNNINQQSVKDIQLPLEFECQDQESKSSGEELFIENDAYFQQDNQQVNHRFSQQRKKFSVFKKPMSSVDIDAQSIKEFDIDSNTETFTDSNIDILNSESEFDRKVTLIADSSKDLKDESNNNSSEDIIIKETK